MFFSRKSVFLFILLLTMASPLFAESLIKDSLSLADKNKSLVDKNKSLVNRSRSLVDINKSLVNDQKTLVNRKKSLVQEDENAVGSYRKSVYSTDVSTNQSAVQDSRISTVNDSYVNNYGAFLNAVASVDPQAKSKFVSYFTDWLWSGQKEDFFSYSSTRAEREKQIEYCYDQAIKKFGIGTAIVATTWVVAVVVPGGSIYQAAVLIIAKETTAGALSGGVVGGVVSTAISLMQGKSGEELIHSTVNAAADGYVIGSVTGLVSGSGSVYKLSKESAKLRDFSGEKIIFDKKVYNSKGTYVGNYNGEITNVNGRSVINRNLVGQESKYGVPYKYYLADDGNGNFFKIVNPDFANQQIVKKVYHMPKEIWGDPTAYKAWCKQAYLDDLKNPNVESILGISKKEAAMRLRVELRQDLRDPSFMKAYNLTEKQIETFRTNYDVGAWHHLPSSGDMLYVPKNHNELAPHTGGNSFWGSKLKQPVPEEAIEW